MQQKEGEEGRTGGGEEETEGGRGSDGPRGAEGRESGKTNPQCLRVFLGDKL